MAQIYHRLCNAIMDGSLAPGMPLKEADMQDLFGVSRAPIREVIRLLEADRMVVVNAYKEKYVRRITREDLREVIPVLARMEGCAAFLTATRITPEQLEAVGRINQDLRAAYQAGDVESCLRLNSSFHRYYVHSAGNETLKQAIRPMIKRVVGLWAANAYRQDPSLFAVTISEHDAALQSFAAGDAQEAEQRVRAHVENMLVRGLQASVFDQQDNLLVASNG
ncbi:MAG: GntR family transcriptional regulator [Thermodesulfobacteriota bacterium]